MRRCLYAVFCGDIGSRCFLHALAAVECNLALTRWGGCAGMEDGKLRVNTELFATQDATLFVLQQRYAAHCTLHTWQIS